MTLAELAPYAAIAGAVGVAVLLLVPPSGPLRAVRLIGFALLAAGFLLLGARVSPAAVDRIQAQPALGAAGGVCALAAILLAAYGLDRAPSLLLPAALGVSFLRVPVGHGSTAANLLLPLYFVIASALVRDAARTLRPGAADERARRGPDLALLGLALLSIVAAASVAWADDPKKAATNIVAFYLPFGALGALIFRSPLPARAIEATVALFLAMGVGFGLLGLWQWHSHHLLWHNTKLLNSNPYAAFFRVNSAFYDPSIFGRFQAFALLVLVCALALGPANRRLAALAVPVAAVTFAGLFVSYSQTSMVALVAGVCVLVGFSFPRRFLGLIVLAALLLAVVGFALPQTRDVFSQGTDKITSGRSGLAERGGRLFEHHPLAGVGSGSFGAASGKGAKQQARLAPHTSVVAIAAELGLLGLAALAVLVAGVVRALRRPTPPGRGGLRRGALVLLCALVVHSLSYNALVEDPLFWSLVALISALSVRPPSGAAERAEAPLEPRPALAASA
jgi:O-antigen ligase